MIGMYSLIVVG